MSWAAPWALVGLLALPLAWWWHRRRRRPPVMDLPSLLFLRPEIDAPPARRRAIDVELLLVLVSLLLLTAAAAGPVLTRRPAGRTVRVVVSRGVPAGARGYAERVDGALEALRGRLGADDVLDVVDEPLAGTGHEPRPSDEALLDVAGAGRAARRLVLSDRAGPREGHPGVDWVALGDPASFNVGIVAARLVPHGSGYDVFVNVQGDVHRAADVRLVLLTGREVVSETSLAVPAGGDASHTFGLSGAGLAVSVELRAPGGGAFSDDLPADDRVAWRRDPLRLAFDAALPASLRRAVEEALVAALGRGGYVEARRDVALGVTTARAARETPATWRLVLHPVGEAGMARAGDGADRRRPDPLVADLSAAGVDLVYAQGALEAGGALPLLLWREDAGRRWGVVARRGRVVHFLPDPTRGHPSPLESPLWPLFVDDLLGQVVGRTSAQGGAYRLFGAWGTDTSRLGAAATALPDLDLAARPADRPARVVSARPWLLLAALVLLALAWGVPWSSPRRASRGALPAVPSAP